MILAAPLLLQAAAPALAPNDTRCRTVMAQTNVAPTVKDRACYDFGLLRSFEGVWLDAFEGQQFFDEATSRDHMRDESGGTWLDVDLAQADRRRWRMAGPGCGHAYRIRFVGAMAANRTDRSRSFRGYGHMGMFARLIVVDHLTAVEDLGQVSLMCRPPLSSDNPR